MINISEKSQVAMADNKNRPKIKRKKTKKDWCFWHEGWGIKSKTPAMIFQSFPICRKCRGY